MIVAVVAAAVAVAAAAAADASRVVVHIGVLVARAVAVAHSRLARTASSTAVVSAGGTTVAAWRRCGDGDAPEYWCSRQCLGLRV
jgi:hypothetical protein